MGIFEKYIVSDSPSFVQDRIETAINLLNGFTFSDKGRSLDNPDNIKIIEFVHALLEISTVTIGFPIKQEIEDYEGKSSDCKLSTDSVLMKKKIDFLIEEIDSLIEEMEARGKGDVSKCKKTIKLKYDTETSPIFLKRKRKYK